MAFILLPGQLSPATRETRDSVRGRRLVIRVRRGRSARAQAVHGRRARRGGKRTLEPTLRHDILSTPQVTPTMAEPVEAASTAELASEPEPEPEVVAAQRDIVISCSTLIRRWQEIAPQVLENALFLFGSKRRWIFPQTDEERRDAQRQPGKLSSSCVQQWICRTSSCVPH